MKRAHEAGHRTNLAVKLQVKAYRDIAEIIRFVSKVKTPYLQRTMKLIECIKKEDIKISRVGDPAEIYAEKFKFREMYPQAKYKILRRVRLWDKFGNVKAEIDVVVLDVETGKVVHVAEVKTPPLKASEARTALKHIMETLKDPNLKEIDHGLKPEQFKGAKTSTVGPKDGVEYDIYLELPSAAFRAVYELFTSVIRGVNK